MRWAGHVAGVRETISVQSTLVGENLKERGYLQKQDINLRIILKRDIKEISLKDAE
jgi:hypothetical protein